MLWPCSTAEEESVGFLFNVTVEVVHAAGCPAARPTENAEFAAAAAAAQQRSAVDVQRARKSSNYAPRVLPRSPAFDLFRSRGGWLGSGAAQRWSPQDADPAGANRRERREAARRQTRGAKPPKSVKR